MHALLAEHGHVHFPGISEENPVRGLRGQGDVAAALVAEEAVEILHGYGDDGFHGGRGRVGGGRGLHGRIHGRLPGHVTGNIFRCAPTSILVRFPGFDLPFPDDRDLLVVDSYVHGVADDGAGRAGLGSGSRRGGRGRCLRLTGRFPVKKKAGGHGHGDRRYQPPAPFSAV